MSGYAVIKIQGHQYKVKEGDSILVDKLKDSKNLKFDVLLLVNGKEVKLGKPFLKDPKLDVKVLGEEKGKKLHILKYKAKSRYRRKMGFRPQYTKLLIEKIS
jgi:large subunit ribosomal protein L21